MFIGKNDKDVLGQLAAQTNDIIPVLATFSKLSISDCKAIMQSVNQDAILSVE